MIFASVISVLKQRGDAEGAALNLWNARTMFDVANLLADAIRDIERRDGPYLAESDIRFNASFILGGQIIGEPMRLNQRPTARRLVVINAEVCRCEKSEDDSAIALAGGRGPDDISGRSTLNGEARINAAVRVSAMRPAARLREHPMRALRTRPGLSAGIVRSKRGRMGEQRVAAVERRQ